MSNYFIKQGNCYSVTDKQNLNIHTLLPKGTYIVGQSMSGFYLEQVDNFPNQGKIYGNTAETVDRIKKTFYDRPKSTGVLLSGEKGSGKTLIAKLLSLSCMEDDIPTILVNRPFCGEDFNSFIGSLTQKFVIIFDEFEKVYDADHQQKLLTLLDGVFSSQKLFILTCNERRIDKNMLNRPGRLFYSLEFEGLDATFITDYCNFNLKDKTQTEPLCRVAGLFYRFNFDMLQAFVQEMNRYNEGPVEVMKYLNTKPDDDYSKYDVKIATKDGEKVDLYEETIGCNPLTLQKVHIKYRNSAELKKYTEDSTGKITCPEWVKISLKPTDLSEVDSKTSTYTYKKNGHTIVFSRKVFKPLTYDHFAYSNLDKVH